MTSSISGSSGGFDISQLQDFLKTNSSGMFSKLSKEAGGDGTSISKDQLQSLIDKDKKEGKDTKPLEDIMKNFDKISTSKDSNGTAVITSSDMDNAMKNGTLKPPSMSGTGSSSSTSDLFTSLLDAIKSSEKDNSDSSSSSSSNDTSSISKSDLQSYLKSLVESLNDNSSSTTSNTSSTSSTSSTDDTNKTKAEIKLVTNMLTNFDSFSDSSGKITSSSFYSALNEPQDPSTVTSSQLESPISLLV